MLIPEIVNRFLFFLFFFFFSLLVDHQVITRAKSGRVSISGNELSPVVSPQH